MKIIKIFFKVIYNIFIILVILLAAAMAFSVLRGPGGIRVFIVQSGSMEPAIKTGSIVVTAPDKNYQKNDVITFMPDPNLNLKDIKATVTHRIVKINLDKTKKPISYIVKGDANNAPDREPVILKGILGKVMISIPYIGRAVAFAKTQTGFIFLIIIPATLVVYSEIMNIKSEIIKIFSRKKNEKQEEKTDEKTNS